LGRIWLRDERRYAEENGDDPGEEEVVLVMMSRMVVGGECELRERVLYGLRSGCE